MKLIGLHYKTIMSEHKKIRIIAEYAAILHLSSNKEFLEGRLFKYILKNLSQILLIMDENEFESQWADSESSIRKFFDSYDIPRPRAISELTKVYSNPSLSYQLDPYAIWLLNRSDKDLNNFREYFGVWAINTQMLIDDYFSIKHYDEFDKDEVINGSTDNGWGNFLEQVNRPLPPINSIVLNDRWIVSNTNEKTAKKQGFWGLNNLTKLFDEILPKKLKIPFHILIYCQHPKLDIVTTDDIFEKFIQNVKKLREYEIVIEVVYSTARHKRGLYTNYFLFDADRGFNVFYNYNHKVLNGENDLSIAAYFNDPTSSGKTVYDIARSKIKKINEACKDVYLNPEEDEDELENIARVKTECTDFFYNRLFS